MDCYLCGTENAPEADFCVRCDGQLLRLPEAELEPEPASEEILEPIDDTEHEIDEHRARRRARKRIIRSSEDRRLHAALGLAEDEDEDEDDLPLSVPTVEVSSVPFIGTNAGSTKFLGGRDESIGRPALIGLVALALLVALLGYRTLDNEPEAQPDEELAFSDSTLPLPPEEIEQDTSWSQAEVAGTFGPTFVSLVLVECDGSAVTDETLTLGVTVDEHNVLYLPQDGVSPDVIRIRGRTSSGVLASPNVERSGLFIATSPVRLTRNLRIVNPPTGEAGYFISRDLEADTNLVAEETSEGEAETIGVSVSTQGEPLSVYMGAREVSLGTLETLSEFSVVADDSIELPEKPTICDLGRRLVDPATIPAETSEDDS